MSSTKNVVKLLGPLQNITAIAIYDFMHCKKIWTHEFFFLNGCRSFADFIYSVIVKHDKFDVFIKYIEAIDVYI